MMTEAERETFLFGAPLCEGCNATGGIYTDTGSPRMPDCPKGYADNWRRCAYCGGSGFAPRNFQEADNAS